MKHRSHSKKPTRLRYSEEAAYARGHETRERLIAAAIRLFGERGFEGASTRDISGAAGLNTPALQYYFNNKEGLYNACATQIVSAGWAVMRSAVLDAERLLAQGAGDAELMKAFCAMQGVLADYVHSSGGDWLRWVAREQAGLGPDAGFLRSHPTSNRMMRAGRSIVARLLGRSPRDPETLVHEMTLGAHLAHLYLLRPSALRTLGWSRINADRLALLKRIALQHTMASLRCMVAAPKNVEARRRPAKRSPGPRGGSLPARRGALYERGMGFSGG